MRRSAHPSSADVRLRSAPCQLETFRVQEAKFRGSAFIELESSARAQSPSPFRATGPAAAHRTAGPRLSSGVPRCRTRTGSPALSRRARAERPVRFLRTSSYASQAGRLRLRQRTASRRDVGPRAILPQIELGNSGLPRRHHSERPGGLESFMGGKPRHGVRSARPPHSMPWISAQPGS